MWNLGIRNSYTLEVSFSIRDGQGYGEVHHLKVNVLKTDNIS